MRFCLTPGCTTRTMAPRCPACARLYVQQQRGSATARGYDWRWYNRSRAFLRSYPRCGMRPHGQAPVLSRCHDEGRVTVATLVDHVVPHRGDQGLFWDDAGNWQALCRDCHATKTAAGQ